MVAGAPDETISILLTTPLAETHSKREVLPMTSFRNLRHEHVGLGLDKQLFLVDALRAPRWGYSIETGVLSFTGGPTQLHLNAEILGSVSDGDGTWLWSWAN